MQAMTQSLTTVPARGGLLSSCTCNSTDWVTRVQYHQNHTASLLESSWFFQWLTRADTCWEVCVKDPLAVGHLRHGHVSAVMAKSTDTLHLIMVNVLITLFTLEMVQNEYCSTVAVWFPQGHTMSAKVAVMVKQAYRCIGCSKSIKHDVHMIMQQNSCAVVSLCHCSAVINYNVNSLPFCECHWWDKTLDLKCVLQ